MPTNKSITDMTAISASDITASDLMYICDDPGGTPLDRKVTVTNLAGAIFKLGQKRQTLTYGASIVVNLSLGSVCELEVTDGVAFQINNPINPTDGQNVTFRIKNASGGAMGVLTWATKYKMETWTNPANNKFKTIRFYYDGTATQYYQIGAQSGDYTL